MQSDIIIAGYGGQGVLFGGVLLAQAAVEAGKETTWFPSYGAEMRGGTANSTVIISDTEIGSPITAAPSGLIALNDLSLARFLPRAAKGAVVVYNSSLIPSPEISGQCTITGIPATTIADRDLHDVRTANLVLIGAFLRLSSLLSLDHAQRACATVLAERPQLIALNQKALEIGFNYRGK
jgi:2-oxoglutarate ferredoxin oxidoreductase subunit gamma